jgi:hypothetical protein
MGHCSIGVYVGLGLCFGYGGVSVVELNRNETASKAEIGPCINLTISLCSSKPQWLHKVTKVFSA